MRVGDDVQAFVFAHRVHGTVTTKASAKTETGYDPRLWCRCGQSYDVYATPEIAAEGFLAQAERN
jgi:hypothetical protein